MNIFAFSDSHANHYLLDVPDCDIVICAGDTTNYKYLPSNEIEFENFLEWFTDLPIKHKILIAGNHDGWATKNYNIEKVKEAGIIYLEHEYAEVEGLKIFGSPYTPTFGEWYFMKDRGKIGRYWEVLEPGIDILITHGPPKGILDLSYDRYGRLEYCGDGALMKAVERVKPRIHCFGHLHNNGECKNQGIRVYNGTKFMNLSLVEDGKMGKLSSDGILFKI